ncbi:hypothetical protein ACFOWE_05650 [Planomonospora corallina]|uniref:Lipoprotein n=1 Tax=Planomonospora corallina TaxID=1806052 RepID=A0ABV8I0X4_9ACTN
MRVAAVGAIALIGMTGCTAEPEAENAAATSSPGATAPGRADIEVQLQPARVKAGEKVWVLANCPIPQGGPEHRGTASSEVFRTPVTLDPILATPTPVPSGTATPTPRPWVRGQATVAGGVKPGVYDINARCEGTNDTGTASLRVVADSTPSARPTTTRTPVSTKAPHTGGGGTAAGGPEDAGTPLGAAGVLVAALLAGGVGIAVVRHRRS